MLEQHLAQANEHVTLGQKHITRQREIIAGFERSGQDTTTAIIF